MSDRPPDPDSAPEPEPEPDLELPPDELPPVVPPVPPVEPEPPVGVPVISGSLTVFLVGSAIIVVAVILAVLLLG